MMGNTFSGNRGNGNPPGYNVPPAFQPHLQPPAFQGYAGYPTAPQPRHPLQAGLDELKRLGLPLNNIERACYAVPDQDVVHLQSLYRALVSHQDADISQTLGNLLIDGTDRSAFQGAIVLIKAGALSMPIFEVNNAGRLTWVHMLAAWGKEPEGLWQSQYMSLGERFQTLSNIGLSLTEFDTQGKSPCIRALERRNERTFNILLDMKDIDSMQLSRSHAVAIAAKYGLANSTNRLVNQLRLDPNDTVDGATALHHAARSGNIEVVRALLATGANPVAESPELRTPWHVANAAEHLDIARLLRRAARRYRSDNSALGAPLRGGAESDHRYSSGTPGDQQTKNLQDFVQAQAELTAATMATMVSMQANWGTTQAVMQGFGGHGCW